MNLAFSLVIPFLVTVGIASPSVTGKPSKKIVQTTSDLKVKALPRIAITGLAIESSTFSPALSNEEAFHAKYNFC